MVATRLSLCFFSLLALTLSGCQKNSPKTDSSRINRTILKSDLPSRALFTYAEQFLEWQRGYSFRIRDIERGLLVTDAIQDSPLERHHVSLRVGDDPKGSLLSIHVVAEVLESSAWAPLASAGGRETDLLNELDRFLSDRPRP